MDFLSIFSPVHIVPAPSTIKNKESVELIQQSETLSFFKNKDLIIKKQAH